ncbi:caspase-3-like [Watersipora subatra]|uniref:caspase-3-like n=1 Tax=Watersipora subatra TaxID=2589382 RepID=UPI00355C571F
MSDTVNHLLRSEEYSRLTQNQLYIRESMDASFMQEAMDYLYAAQLIDFATYQNFGEVPLTAAKAALVFRLLITGTSHRYNAFCDFCKDMHPEMYELLYVADYMAVSSLESCTTTDSAQVDVQPDSTCSDLLPTVTRCRSPPATLLNLDTQAPVIDINVIPVTSKRIRDKLTRTKTVYATSYPVRGIAMLFFHINFTDRNFPTRTGAEHDLTNLSRLFHQLNYNVMIFKDMTRAEVLTELNTQRKSEEHSNYGSFILGFSTHGAKESKAIACSDGQSLFLTDIYNHFDSTHCPYLAGKPKFIFFDASFGCAQDRAVPLNRILEPPKTFEPVKKQLADISFSLSNIRLDTLTLYQAPVSKLVTVNVSSNQTGPVNYKVANRSDFIIAMSTVDGYVSWRRNSHGCWFSRLMVEVFQKHAADHHLLELLKIIRCKLSYLETKTGYKQVNTTIDTSLKQFYFFPGLQL